MACFAKTFVIQGVPRFLAIKPQVTAISDVKLVCLATRANVPAVTVTR